MIIQKVAITTEEVQFKKQVEALRTALEQHEAKGRPRLDLRFDKRTPPFITKPETEEIIEFTVFLEQGDIAKNVEVVLLAPEGFEFPERETFHQPESSTFLPNAIGARIRLGSLLEGQVYGVKLAIKSPTQKGQFAITYRLRCEYFISNKKSFVVKVE